MRFCVFFILFFSFICWAQTNTRPSTQQIDEWEKYILKELTKLPLLSQEKEWFLIMSAAREFKAYNYLKKSQDYYLKAFNHSYQGDKSEAVIELLALAYDQQEELAPHVERAQTWFKKNPNHASKEIKDWLHLMNGYTKGETPTRDIPTYHLIWAQDQRIQELMKAHKYSEAYQLLGPQSLEEANINDKIRYDLLTSLVMGKKASPSLWCAPVLAEYPTSITWSMRVCRYLKAWREGTKSPETITSIKEQLNKENPERLYWVQALDKL
jgi:hypothetical protein